jgi:ubiquitin-protein ligase
MELNFIRDKRIKSDIRNYIKGDLNTCGIYCHIDEYDMTTINAMIIGPGGTPYENGFYFFILKFPNDYPYSPPSVKYITQDDNIRFNPNLYVNGKVCLSILGTWAGPGWSSCLTLNSVLLSIQSLLNENPIHNEPGFEKEMGTKCKTYNKIIEYYNIKGATIKMMEHTPYGFDVFKEIMAKHYIKNIGFYKNYTETNKKHDKINLISNIYSLNIRMYINELEKKIDYLYKLCIDKYPPTETPPKPTGVHPKPTGTPMNCPIDTSSSMDEHPPPIGTSTPINSISTPIQKKKYTRKCPNDPAKLYEVGYVKLSEFNNKEYKVIQINGPKRTMKKWVLNT